MKSNNSNKSSTSESTNKIAEKTDKSKGKCEERFTEYIAKDNIPNMITRLLTLKCARLTFLQSMNLVEENASYQMKYKCCNISQ